MRREVFKKMLENDCGTAVAIGLVTPYKVKGHEFGTIEFRKEEGYFRLCEDYVIVCPNSPVSLYLGKMASFIIPYEQIAFVIDHAFSAADTVPVAV